MFASSNRRFLAVAACLLLGSAQAQAVPETFLFSGTMIDGFGFNGQTVSGSLTIDPHQLVGYRNTDSSTYFVAEQIAGPDQSFISGSLTLSGGLAVTLGTGEQNVGEVQIYRSPGFARFLVGGVSDYYFGRTEPVVNQIFLDTEDMLTFGSTIFDSPAGDIYPEQTVNWLTPGSTNFGTFATGQGGESFGKFTLTSVTGGYVATPIPEPPMYALLLLGLAGIGSRTWRYRGYF